MHGVTKQQILEDFEEFKAYLHQKISAGKKLGLDDSKIIKSAAILGTISPNTRSPAMRKKNSYKNCGTLRMTMKNSIWPSFSSNLPDTDTVPGFLCSVIRVVLHWTYVCERSHFSTCGLLSSGLFSLLKASFLPFTE